MFKIPVVNCAFETAAVTAAGVRAGLDLRGDKDAHVVAIAGDGGTYDIGLQALSGAAERNDNIIYVCYDNEAYMNTGNQRSSSTPDAAITMTTPKASPKREMKKDLVGIMKAHHIPYLATATIGYPKDLQRKVEEAMKVEGFRFILALSPCPTGWKFDPKYSIKMSRLAVKSGIFPILEAVHGVEISRKKISKEKQEIYMKEYLELQRRFN
jgi:pyruvate/2-oxoacid:ferredoxin oxidoreductase beta subunit